MDLILTLGSSSILYGIVQNYFIHVVYWFFSSMGVFVAIWDKGDKISYRIHSHFDSPVEVFDFIVVGSGPSGAVVANRLSENPNSKVLLIEAGGEPTPWQMVPGLSPYMLHYDQIDWGHVTVPQQHACYGLKDRRSTWSQGKSLGGTSNLNFLVHLRGSPSDYDRWANITGDPSWTYENVLPYFRKSENFRREWFPGSEHVHGKGGPVSVEIPAYRPLADSFINAGKEFGYDHADLNGYYTQGFDYIHYAAHNGRRSAVFDAYIRRARRRPNLTIYKFTVANKILLHGHLNEAYGVEYSKLGRWGTAYATKEVIVSGGTVQTPKLLMLSGIGPADHLLSFGIKPKVNLPVGNNLQDHMSTYLGPFIMDAPGSFVFPRDVTIGALRDYALKGTGPLTTSSVAATAIYSSSYAYEHGESHWPDMQILLSIASIYTTFPRHLHKGFRVDEKLSYKYYKPSFNKDSFTMVVSVGRPLSRGYIRLKSANPKDEVLIDPRYYEREEDALRMIEGMKFATMLAENSQAFKEYGRVKLTSNPLPGCENVPYRSDSYWDCYMRTISITLHHSVGTASMGKYGSPHAVVDSQFRVIGTKGLRVVDASVIPEVPVSNIQAVCIMLGEKASDIIANAWLNDPLLGGFKKRSSKFKSGKKKPLLFRLDGITKVTANITEAGTTNSTL
ncbi:unnamed protein product [Allacma fusca]|uniref:Glucose-methanol-choline oxidoreductase N-terminal domain-containing protein n=1 Tax=Allacma fusca TaxID=39272 RepID=A0A8J2PNA8_9HEXA|nr:unnamed protein product [Allacma fusca]